MQAKKHLSCPIYVMFRPRGGDFFYSKTEKDQILFDIENALRYNIDGGVIGALLENGELDYDFLKVVKQSFPELKFTFHRAFDRCVNPLEALQTLIDLGFENILTSGQFSTAEKGIENLRKYVDAAQKKINILVGSGVNPQNIESFWDIGIRDFHFSAGINSSSKMVYANKNFNVIDGQFPTVNKEEIRAAKNLIGRLSKN